MSNASANETGGKGEREMDKQQGSERARERERERERESYLAIYICGLEHGTSSISHVISKEAVLTTVTTLQA